VPGWLDKGLKWRHRTTKFLDNMLVLAPDPAWVAKLPNRKLPDRTDFAKYGTDLKGRVKVWTDAVRASEDLAGEFEGWIGKQDFGRIEAL
jgi:hypothetical protein